MARETTAIIANIRKIRQQTLKKFLYSLLEPDFEIPSARNVKTRKINERTKHDYKLATDVLLMIMDQWDGAPARLEIAKILREKEKTE
jgi:transcriptional regulatory protein LevR